MEVNLKQNEQAGDDEDYVLLDLDSVCIQADIPANTPYVLSGLDTLNPVLTIGNHLKLIGEYQETIGTCYVFSESDGVPKVLHPETDPSETNLPKDTSTIKSTQVPTKEVKLITSLHRILKFRLASQDESQAAIRSNAETRHIDTTQPVPMSLEPVEPNQESRDKPNPRESGPTLRRESRRSRQRPSWTRDYTF